MVNRFHCPNCGGPLDYQVGGGLTVRCHICNNSLIVPEELRSPNQSVTTRDQVTQVSTLTTPPQTVTEAVLEQLRNLTTQTTDARELRCPQRTEHRIMRHQNQDERRSQRRGKP